MAGRFREWDEKHPADFVGHSIGGVTLRVLQQLLEAGAFPGHQTSAAWMRSLTTISSPHNGDPVIYSLGARSVTSSPLLAAWEQRPPAGPWPQLPDAGIKPRVDGEVALPAPVLVAPLSSNPGPIRMLSMGWWLTLACHLLSWLDWSPLNDLVDLNLDHWWLSRRRCEWRPAWKHSKHAMHARTA